MRKILIAAAIGSLCGAPAFATPPPEASSSNAGMVTKMSLEDLKAIYDSAGVAYEVRAFADGKEYLAAAPEGYRMYAVLTTCPDAAKAVDCSVLSLESGTWERKLTAEQLAVFNSYPLLGKAFLNEGFPAVSYAFVLEPGVAPDYVRTSLRHFVNLMKYFGGFEWLPADAAAEAAPAPAPAGTFAAPAVSDAANAVGPANDVTPSTR